MSNGLHEGSMATKKAKNCTSELVPGFNISSTTTGRFEAGGSVGAEKLSSL